MEMRLFSAPWASPVMTPEAAEAVDIVGNNLWADASVRFYAERDAKLRAGQRAPKGMQGTLNALLESRFGEAGWLGDSGCFVKRETWIRMTFRHQMSIGSDIIDAIKACKKEGVKLAIIAAADEETLKTITPNDAKALVSFEKLRREVQSLDGALDIPLVIARLSPKSRASKAIDDELRRERPRDLTIPAARPRT